jgi:hypothetical protein
LVLIVDVETEFADEPHIALERNLNTAQ